LSPLERSKIVYRDGSLLLTSLPYKLDIFKKGTEGYIHPCCSSNKDKGNFTTYRFIFFAVRKRDNRLIGVSDYSVPFVIQARSNWSSQQLRDSASNLFFNRRHYISTYVQYEPPQKLSNGRMTPIYHAINKKEENEEFVSVDGRVSEHLISLKKPMEILPLQISRKRRLSEGYDSHNSMEDVSGLDESVVSREITALQSLPISTFIARGTPTSNKRLLVEKMKSQQAVHVVMSEHMMNPSSSSASTSPSTSSSPPSSTPSPVQPPPTSSTPTFCMTSASATYVPNKPLGFVQVGNVEYTCTMLMRLADENDRSMYIVVTEPNGELSINVNNVLSPIVRTWKQCYETRKHCSSGYSPRNSISFQSLFHDIELSRLRVPTLYKTIPFEPLAQFGNPKSLNSIPLIPLQNCPPYSDFHDLLTFVSENFVNRRALPIPRDPFNRKRNRNGFYLSTNPTLNDARLSTSEKTVPSVPLDADVDESDKTQQSDSNSTTDAPKKPIYQPPITEAELLQINRCMFQFITMHFRTHGPRLVEKIVRAQIHASNRFENLISSGATHPQSSFIVSATSTSSSTPATAFTDSLSGTELVNPARDVAAEV
jgi:hypothetical protein